MNIDKQREKKLQGKWIYLYCVNSYKGKHRIKCVKCGRERTVSSLTNVKECVCIKQERKAQQKEDAKIKTCIVCGKSFKPIRSTRIYCSDKCERKAYKNRHLEEWREKQRIRKRLREARATNNGKVDYSITLTKLIERDNHICQLCGTKVNDSDYVYDKDTFVAGNDYPSIDHIKPLSKGGLHQWNNVQLAHRICNSIKRDKE